MKEGREKRSQEKKRSKKRKELMRYGNGNKTLACSPLEITEHDYSSYM